MGSVVHLNIPFRQSTQAARQSALIERFACQRRSQEDVFWLKENAEVLNILESTQACLDENALAPFEAFYETLSQRLEFFPQYYRFLLSICLDLEDLGLGSARGERAVKWVIDQNLPGAELSDLQRAEARRLCQRRGLDPMKGDAGLDDRLRLFGTRNETFALPNKKAAYELTHIVFYLSQYGRKDPDLPDGFIQSLHFAGTLAFLELNTDLLAEVCLALRFAHETPPAIWERWLSGQADRIVITNDASGWTGDDYHPYLMAQWFQGVSIGRGFDQQLPEGPVSFVAPRADVAPLRELSQSLYAMEDERDADWEAMRPALSLHLSEAALDVIHAAETAIDFDAFFAGFARASAQRVHA